MSDSPVADMHDGGSDHARSSKTSGDNEAQDKSNPRCDAQPQKKPGNSISRLLKRRSLPAKNEAPEQFSDTSKGTSQKRRQQVYQAQKRHRNRKAEYVSNLEAEIAQLRHLDSVAQAEMNALAHENKIMRELLASKSIDTQLESISLTPTPLASEDMSQLGSAAVAVRFDPVVGHERTFIDVSARSDVDDGGNDTNGAKQTMGDGDNWAALDFILALEHCCQDHTYHSGINPTAHDCDHGDSTGHALSMSAAVYQSAIPPGSDAEEEDTAVNGGIRSQVRSGEEAWQLPHSEIDKLVTMSEQLPIDDSEMTPAQAYAAILKNVPDAAYVKPVMEALKVLLAPHMACFGFGAVMPAFAFWEHLDTVLKTLGLEAQES